MPSLCVGLRSLRLWLELLRFGNRARESAASIIHFALAPHFQLMV
jgi:hypothetical protein